jgi:hypothetical protein
METEKAKKTRRKEAMKSGTKEGVKEKRTKGSRKEATKKTTTKQVIRVKDVGELVEYCKTLLGRKPFEGAAIDFHPKKPSFIFLPTEFSVAKVPAEELLDYLQKKGVQRVLIDALNKKRVPILLKLCKAGIEVYVLRRPMQIERMRRELRYRNIEVPKSDKYDAVLLAFTSPKKWALVDARFLKSWEAMVEWRNAETSFLVEQQRYDANNSEGPKEDEESEELRIKELIRAKLVEVQRLLEEVQKLEAQLFVLKVQKNYPGVDEDFDKYGIRDDVIAQAYYCEAFLEALHCDSEAGFLVKSGIGKAGSPPAKQRKKKFIHDGALNRALVQLTVKVYHLNPYKAEDQKKIKMKARKLAEKIWRKAQKMKAEIESGRVGEAWGRPLSKREGSDVSSPSFGTGPPAKAGV